VGDLSALLQNAFALKHLKLEVDLKHHKLEKWEHPKWEKFEKWEHPKWEKIEKWEHEPIPKPIREPIPKGFEPGPDPRQTDPRIEQLIAVVTELQKQVEALRGR